MPTGLKAAATARNRHLHRGIQRVHTRQKDNRQPKSLP